MKLHTRLVVILITLIFPIACSHGGKKISHSNLGQEAARQALAMLGTPYLYGGHTREGFDCSGLIHYSYRQIGVELPRSTSDLKKHSRPVSEKNLERGDLLFFHQPGKRSSHVGLYIGNERFVHAPSTGKYVHISELSNPYWRKHFAGARRPDAY
jgi:murein DD-endopeptidase